MKSEFIKKEVAKVLDITPRTIHFYTDEGLVIPEKANPAGRGTTRKYSRRNLVEFALPVKIGDNVWLGAGVIINPGVTIGDNSVIGSGSVVTKDIPEDSIFAGNPAKFIRKIDY